MTPFIMVACGLCSRQSTVEHELNPNVKFVTRTCSEAKIFFAAEK